MNKGIKKASISSKGHARDPNISRLVVMMVFVFILMTVLRPRNF
jgi:hypothetical protein